MNPEPLHKVRNIIAKQCPKYLIEFDLLQHRRGMHAFNMLIMKREILDQYCSWLFPILFELEKQIDTTNWSAFERRYIGRISERLLDIWINTNHISYTEIPVIDIEPVNWVKKGTGFLQAKFFGRKYEKKLVKKQILMQRTSLTPSFQSSYQYITSKDILGNVYAPL